MIKKLGLLLLPILLLATVWTAGTGVSYAAAKDEVCAGAGIANGGACSAPTNGITVPKLISAVISILSWATGIIAVIMIVVGAAKYITSGGDSSKITSAKNTLMYALIGLVIAALAQVLVRFVLNKSA